MNVIDLELARHRSPRALIARTRPGSNNVPAVFAPGKPPVRGCNQIDTAAANCNGAIFAWDLGARLVRPKLSIGPSRQLYWLRESKNLAKLTITIASAVQPRGCSHERNGEFAKGSPK